MPKEGNEPGDEVLAVLPSGTVLTEELAEQWATEFESEDFEPVDWKPRYVISLFPRQADVGPGIPFPLSPAEVDVLKKRAQEEDRPLAVLLREALDS